MEKPKSLKGEREEPVGAVEGVVAAAERHDGEEMVVRAWKVGEVKNCTTLTQVQ